MIEETNQQNSHLLQETHLHGEYILGNATQLNQVVLNICINAVHGIGKKEGRITFRVSCAAREELPKIPQLANVLASFIPQSLGRFLPLIIGILSVPLTLLFCTDSYFFGLLPVLIGIGNEFSVNPAHTAIVMVVCRNCATFISPVVPATFLGVGLAGIEIKDHIKASFFWIWGVSMVCLIAGIVLGVLHF